MEDHKSKKTVLRLVGQEKNTDLHTKLLAATMVVSILSFLGVVGIYGKVNNITGLAVGDTGGTESPPQQLPPTQEAGRVQVSVDDDPVLGDPDAPITIIEFSDYQCPYCGRFYSETLPQLKQQYVDTGKVKIVYRDFALSFHPEAVPAALAAQCAGDQGKYFEFHDKIFENQGSLSATNYKAWAAELGLDTGEFNSCFDSSKYSAEVQNDFNDGTKAGVSGTPSFFIGTEEGGYVKLVGAQPFGAFQQAIEAELN